MKFNLYGVINNGFFRVVALTILILLLPLIAMQFTHEVNWGLLDFVVMALLLLGSGSLFVIISRRVPQKSFIIAIILLLVLLLSWAELAVGLFH